MLSQERKQRYHKQELKKVSRQIRNSSDANAERENLMNGLEFLTEDMKMVKMATYFIYHDTRKLR